ncbi:MAG: DUF5666 domain-containing protein [Ideonella sp.]|nr:DUF5666 domain-containing protein [Ideonella sp.]
MSLAWLSRAAALMAAALVTACGGGGSPGGDAATAVSVGTVTGFGSVIVDGVRYDDQAATLSLDTEPGAPDDRPGAIQLKLGQRVVMLTTGDDRGARALRVNVSAEVVGRVSSTSPDLVVAGQVVTVNADAAAGPVTVFDGFSGLADIAIGDRAEVHGVPRVVSGRLVIQATRIERKPSAEAWVRVAGAVSDLAADASSFRIGGLTVQVDRGTRVVPRGAALANGQRVVVWSTGAQTGNTIDASWIRIRRGEQQGADEFRLAGPVSDCAPPCAGGFSVGGVSVDASRAEFRNGTAADLANGRWVLVRGSQSADGSSVAATRVILGRTPGDAEVTLRGAVTDYVDAQNFRVRGVPVTTTGGTVFASNCPNPLADGTLVEVQGRVEGIHVVADDIACRSASDGTVVQAKGLVTGWNPSAGTFRLPGSLFTGLLLQVGPQTVYEDGSAGDLRNGSFVEIDGVVTGTTVAVTRVEFEPLRDGLPAGLIVHETEGIASSIAGPAGAITSITVNGMTFGVDGLTAFAPGIASVVEGAQVKVLFRKEGGTNIAVALIAKD